MSRFVSVSGAVRGRAGMDLRMCTAWHVPGAHGTGLQRRGSRSRWERLFWGWISDAKRTPLGSATNSEFCHSRPSWVKFRPGKGWRVKPMRGCGTKVRVTRVWAAFPQRIPRERWAVALNKGIHTGGPHLSPTCPQGPTAGCPNLQMSL